VLCSYKWIVDTVNPRIEAGPQIEAGVLVYILGAPYW